MSNLTPDQQMDLILRTKGYVRLNDSIVESSAVEDLLGRILKKVEAKSKRKPAKKRGGNK